MAPYDKLRDEGEFLMRAQAAATVGGSVGVPRQIQMLTKRMEEAAEFAASISQRAHGNLARILGDVPTGNCDQAVKDFAEPAGEWSALLAAFSRVERAIAELDGAARRLEGL